MKLKEKLLVELKKDIDFKPYISILDEVIEGISISDYILDVRYIDVSYIVIDNVIIDLDSIFYLCDSWND